MAEMKARTRFMNNGSFINKGETFTVSEDLVREYETRDLARRIEETSEVKIEGASNFQEYTVPQLKEMAKERNIEGYREMKKAELIEALERAE